MNFCSVSFIPLLVDEATLNSAKKVLQDKNMNSCKKEVMKFQKMRCVSISCSS